ncbi:hypothetical protein P0Y43_15370 [Pseudomonas entomophila]|uniref:hypothetical protein n=1 Tax=Pseudomonas entomophila TaxID=312306 RepID=UPI0023D8AC7B|nr:hypothetical protein [Pseudomonas entomophila]MDF0732095.1 hypothetical protein [Pseudomonas entomophila]
MPDMALYKVKLLDEFEAREDQWTFAQFDRRLSEVKPAANYQDAKGILNAAYQAGSWPNTVKRYLLTNFKVFGNVSGELQAIFDQVVATLTPQERQHWQLE